MRKHSELLTHTCARWHIIGLSHGEQKPAAQINATPSHLCLQPVATSSSLCLEFIPEGRVVTVSSSLFSRTPLYKHIQTGLCLWAQLPTCCPPSESPASPGLSCLCLEEQDRFLHVFYLIQAELPRPKDFSHFTCPRVRGLLTTCF